MRTLSKITVLALIVSSVSFVGCKKGEGDPFLSLSSRKARLANEWKVTKGEGTRSYLFGNTTITETMTYDGSTETTVTNPGNSTSTDKYTWEITFEKDGTFKMVRTDNNTSTAFVETTTGKWNFTGGVGEAKNKSQVVMYTESYTAGSTSSTYTGADRPVAMYDIYQLKGKEVILEYKGTASATSENNDFTWTLEPK